MNVLSRIATVLGGASLLLLSCSHSDSHTTAANFPTPKLKRISEEMYGIRTDSLQVEQAPIKQNQLLSELLAARGIDRQLIHRISEESRPVFDVRRMRAGQPLTFIRDCKTESVHYVIYEKNAADYVVYDLRNGLKVYEGRKPVQMKHREVSGLIESSFFDAIEENGMNIDLAIQLEDIFECSVDFFHLQKGDFFKIIFDEEFVNGESIGVKRVYTAQFHHVRKDFFAVAFEQDGTRYFFDEEGNSLKKAFLKAPLKYTRISSRYNLRRFHPVLRRVKAHLGTDYAAPAGTPIFAVGDGIIEKACYEGGNGNNVKIRHNSIFETQYLHMSRFASGIRAGAHVSQGQMIGYVGSTGLATGPHLCYRFWKNGKQVDPYGVTMPPSEPVKPATREAFNKLKNEMLQRLNTIEVHPAGETFAQM